MWNRRRFLTAAAVLGAGGLGLALRPSDRGGSHSEYYRGLSKALDEAGLARPSLVIDRQRFFRVVDTLKLEKSRERLRAGLKEIDAQE